MKYTLILPAAIAAALLSTPASALSSFPDGTVGIGGFEPGTTRTTDTTSTSTSTKSRGNKGGKDGRSGKGGSKKK